MKSILLTTTAIVAFAGAAAADGHISMSWSGSATAGVAREGDTGTDAVAAVVIPGLTAPTAFITRDAANTAGAELTSAEESAAEAATDAAIAGSAAVPAAVGDFDSYAEINTAVTGTVATDNGLTLSATLSVDGGRGYDFADDDGFDSTSPSFGGGLDNVVLDAGTFGTLTFDKNDLAHLVDDDDDDQADVMYTNDFGIAKFSFVLDIATDTDVEAAREAWAIVADADLAAGDIYSIAPTTDNLVYTAAAVADVQWSAKVEAPVADIATVYAAFDEEGGYDFGGSATVAGVTLNAKAKSEALAVAEGDDTEFEVGASYTVSGLTVGATYNTVDDGDQWGISGAYTMGAISVAASTDEGEDWEVTGSYDLGSGASLEAGVNYTEDAFVGVSFKF